MEAAPNVLWIQISNLRADALSQPEGTPGATPVLGGLAADGVVFEQVRATSDSTVASTAAMFTAQANGLTESGMVSESALTWAEVLQDRGITTGALVNHSDLTSARGFARGLDSFVYEAPDYPLRGTDSVVRLSVYQALLALREGAGSDQREVAEYYQPIDGVLADAQGFVEANRRGRWALFVHLMEPQAPYFEHPYLSGEGPREFNGRAHGPDFDAAGPQDPGALREVYQLEVAHLDQKLARLIGWLKSEGLYEQTLIVVTSDHGVVFPGAGGEAAQVPLIIKPTDPRLAGRRVVEKASTVDIAGTVLGQMGIARPSSWSSTDLMQPVIAEVEAEEALLDEAAAEGAADALEAGGPNEGEEGQQVDATED
jgi:arylsulfatase A-like enzyme